MIKKIKLWWLRFLVNNLYYCLEHLGGSAIQDVEDRISIIDDIIFVENEIRKITKK
jgi:hypothetical protein